MSPDLEGRDPGLHRLLREALADDRPRPSLRAQLASIPSLDALDLELAAMVSDSSTDLHPAGMRGTSRGWSLTLESASLTIEIEINPSGQDTTSITGSVTPAAVYAVRFERPASTVTRQTTPTGAFAVEGLARGPVRIVIGRNDAGAPDVATEWIVI